MIPGKNSPFTAVQARDHSLDVTMALYSGNVATVKDEG